MGPIINYREEERECATTSGKFNYFSQVPALMVEPRQSMDRLPMVGPCRGMFHRRDASRSRHRQAVHASFRFLGS